MIRIKSDQILSKFIIKLYRTGGVNTYTKKIVEFLPSSPEVGMLTPSVMNYTSSSAHSVEEFLSSKPKDI